MSGDVRVRLGVSSCLLGHPVRFDGGHRRDAFVADTLGPYVEWVPVCPELEAGLGAPRPALRLVKAGEDVRLVTVHGARDLTDVVRAHAVRRADELARLDLDGFVLKKDSPTCGRERVKVYGAGGRPARQGRGLFAQALAERAPLLPMEEEGRLCDPALREHFVERVFAYRRLRDLQSAPRPRAAFVAFHTRHKLQLLAHSPAHYAALGRMVAAGTRRREWWEEYAETFLSALAVPATRARHVNVLQHLAGYFRGRLEETGRHALGGTIADYQRGLVPLAVPTTLIAHHAQRFGMDYVLGQAYLQPHPRGLRAGSDA